MQIKKISKGVYLSFLAIIGCATVDDTKNDVLDASYPEMMAPVRQDVATNNLKQAITDNDNNVPDDIELESLKSLEKARLLQFDNQYDASIEAYNKAMSTVPTTQQAAKDQVVKILSDKNTYNYYEIKTKYYIPDYAISFLYTYQSLNYLKKHDLKKALDILGGINYGIYWYQEQDMLAGGMKELGQELFDKYHVRTRTLGLKYFEELNGMIEYAERIPNAYNNPLSNYLQAILIESNQKDYKKALASINIARENTVGNKYLDDTAREYQKAIYSQTSPYSMGMGRIVVFYEQGLVNSRQFTLASLKLGDLGIVEFSFPYYSSEYSFAEPVSVTLSDLQNKKVIDSYTEILMDDTLYATKSLVEEYSKIITKDALVDMAKQNYDNNAQGLGGLLGNHLKFNFSEKDPRRADLRSWLLLPNSVQLFEQQIDSGDYIIQVNGVHQKIKVKQAKTTLLWITDIEKFKKINYFIL